MPVVNKSFGSGEYSPTPSHSLPAFINGKMTGYVCTRCGHIQKDLDPIFDDRCLICLKDWAIKQGVTKLIPTADAVEQEKALVKTVVVKKSRAEKTTEIIKKR